MKLAMEVPVKLLPILGPLAEFDFVLAHIALENKEYAEYFRQSRKFKILDNGLHERGVPMTCKELSKAAELTNPSVIIAPDWINDSRKTLQGFKEAVATFSGRYRSAIVLWGNTEEERYSLFEQTRKEAYMLCLPFRAPRYEWFLDLVKRTPKYVQWPPRVHLLGVNKLTELQSFAQTFSDMGMVERTSVDTSKPIKFGLSHRRLDETMELRGQGLLDHDSKRMDEETLNYILYNICFLRKFM